MPTTNKSRAETKERMEKTAGDPLGATEVIPKQDGRFRSGSTANASKKHQNDDNDEAKHHPKRVRTWSFASSEDLETTKKVRVENEGREKTAESPARQTRDPAYAWPQRSPMKTEHPRDGGEIRCDVDETNASSPSSRSREQQEQHDEVEHALFTESFDTISACPSAMDAIQEQNSEDDGLLSDHQKTHTPTDDDAIAMLSPKRESRHDSQSSNQCLYDSAEGMREEKGNPHGMYNKHSPHSPPQRVVHVDGDENGCGDISPIKFSPPTESSPPHHCDHSTPPYEIKLSSNNQYGDDQYIATPENERNEHQKAAEVSFDTSAGSRESKQKLNSPPIFSRNRSGENGDSGRTRSHSASIFSEAKTPPRRGTTRSHSSDKERYDSKYSMATRNPRDISHHYYNATYFSHQQPIISDGDIPPGARHFHTDPSRVYQQVRNENVGRSRFSSPIRPSRPTFRETNVNKDQNYYIYGESPANHAQHPYDSGTWRGHNTNSSDIHPYPPPQARLQPQMEHHYWNQNHDAQYRHHMHISSDALTKGIPSYGHSKGQSGSSLVTSVTAVRSRRRHHHHQSPSIPQHYQPHAPMSSATLTPGRSPKDQFGLFRSIRKIFQGCSYLLYPAHMGVQWGDNRQIIHTDKDNLKVARRRVESAICALGGYIKDVQNREESPNTSPSSSSLSHPAPPASVFRRRDDYSDRNNTSIYWDRFHNRYFVGDHGVSWEVEENPPVLVSLDEDDDIQNDNDAGSRSSRRNRSGVQKSSRNGKEVKDHKQPHQQTDDSDSLLVCQPIGTMIPLNIHQKMKYRCKLCGQPKQNHVCPYQKSLVRTLGIMVCPAVNAYSSVEPGVLTPPLSEMNNFVPYGRSEDESSDLEAEISSRGYNSSSSYNVTPGGTGKQNGQYRRYHSPSSLSTSPYSQDNPTPRHHHSSHMPRKPGQRETNGTPTSLWQQRKPRLEYPQQQASFMTLALRPEHYRAVTPRTPYRNGSSSGKVTEEERDDREESSSYEYPHVPLTFLGRKRLTDTLFYLSQSIPSVTADVASLLRMARERDEWDLAVAEVLTQIVVCIHCSDGDYRLDGLRTYLLKIGIAS